MIYRPEIIANSRPATYLADAKVELNHRVIQRGYHAHLFHFSITLSQFTLSPYHNWPGLLSVLESFGELKKFMEIDNAIFQDLESFGKMKFSNWLYKSFGFLLGKILKYPKMDIT